MGMFDTFWGDYKCDHCGNIVHFEEQTKDYELILADYLLGDYCDKGNANYYYEFESYCPECHQKHNVRIAIRRGQYVGIYMDYEAAEIPIENLDNIEDGYLRNIHKKQRYENKLGEAEDADIKAFGKNTMSGIRFKYSVSNG